MNQSSVLLLFKRFGRHQVTPDTTHRQISFGRNKQNGELGMNVPQYFANQMVRYVNLFRWTLILIGGFRVLSCFDVTLFCIVDLNSSFMNILDLNLKQRMFTISITKLSSIYLGGCMDHIYSPLWHTKLCRRQRMWPSIGRQEIYVSQKHNTCKLWLDDSHPLLT